MNRNYFKFIIWQNIEALGKELRKCIDEGKVKREDLFITTKVWPTYYGAKRVIKCVEKMIKESGLEYFDLVLLHWPMSFADSDSESFPLDPLTGNVKFSTRDYVDVYKELETVHQKHGLTKSIGVSNFTIEQLKRIIESCTVMPITNQVECHVYLPQYEMQKYCLLHGITVTGYCPLGHKPETGKTSALADKIVNQIAQKHGKTSAQILLRWLIQRGIIAIPRTTKPKRLKENIDIFDFKLTDNDFNSLDMLNRNEKGRLNTFSKLGIDLHPDYPFQKIEISNSSNFN